MASTSSALNVLDESSIEVKSVGRLVRAYALFHGIRYLMTKLQSGISSPSSAIDVANCIREIRNNRFGQ